MKIQPYNNKYKLIGDPHFGKEFITGVPLDRRGEREASQLTKFKEELEDVEGCEAVIIMGDLFDKFVVNNNVLLNVYQAINERTHSLPIYILRGNHDISRDKDKKSSFEVLMTLFSDDYEVIFVDNVETFQHEGEWILLVPFIDDVPTEQFIKLSEIYVGEEAKVVAFGHWDTESFGGSDHNLIPTKYLNSENITKAYTGHIHTPSKFTRDGVEVTVVGSMLPYTHAEDPDGDIYVTVSLKEYADKLDTDKDYFKNKAVRFMLADGEVIPEDVNALQVSFIRKTDKTEDESVEVEMEAFSFENIFRESLRENNVPEEEINIVWENFKEMTNVEVD